MIIFILFVFYILAVLGFLMMFDYLDKHNVNPFISTPKKLLWFCILPFHNKVRDMIVFLRLRKPNRQPFYIGRAKHSPEFIEAYFNDKGFENIKIAWLDDGEILSMRKIEDKYYQHHVRLFNDGEIRGHFEMTPESHMIKHLFSIDMVPSILLEKLVKELRYTYAA